MSKYQVGDKVVLATIRAGEIVTIYRKDGKGYNLEYSSGHRGIAIWYDHEIEHKIIGEPMSKYECLKQRIEALDDGWNKEADDVLAEINTVYDICFRTYDDGGGRINLFKNMYKTDDGNGDFSKEFNTQCQKMQAFKSALLWLLDHSDMKNEKQDKIKELEAKVKEIQREIKELK